MWSALGKGNVVATRPIASMEEVTDLLHDASFSLGKGNVSTRLVLNELDFDLSSLATWLVVVVVIVVGGSGRSAWTFDTSVFASAIAE